MNKFYKLIGIIASMAVGVCILTACSFEYSFYEKGVTFSLDKKENYSFTITVKGAKWENFTYDTYKVGSLVKISNTIFVVDEQNKEYGFIFYDAFPVTNWKRTSDTVVTATFVNGYTLTRKMEIEFAFPGSVWFDSIASKLIIGGDEWDNYKVNPAKSSIVWE